MALRCRKRKLCANDIEKLSRFESRLQRKKLELHTQYTNILSEIDAVRQGFKFFFENESQNGASTELIALNNEFELEDKKASKKTHQITFFSTKLTQLKSIFEKLKKNIAVIHEQKRAEYVTHFQEVKKNNATQYEYFKALVKKNGLHLMEAVEELNKLSLESTNTSILIKEGNIETTSLEEIHPISLLLKEQNKPEALKNKAAKLESMQKKVGHFAIGRADSQRKELEKYSKRAIPVILSEEFKCPKGLSGLEKLANQMFSESLVLDFLNWLASILDDLFPFIKEVKNSLIKNGTLGANTFRTLFKNELRKVDDTDIPFKEKEPSAITIRPHPN